MSKKSRIVHIAFSTIMCDWIAFVFGTGLFFMKEIQLTQGYVALVDDADYEWISTFYWYAHIDKKTIYARAYNPVTKKQVRMHRLIMEAVDPLVKIDHRDGNGLNNQRSNLRDATTSQNAMNMRKHKGDSGYKGVFKRKDSNRYEAYIRIGGNRVYLGLFESKEEAAKTYNKEALKHFGEFALLNIV